MDPSIPLSVTEEEVKLEDPWGEEELKNFELDIIEIPHLIRIEEDEEVEEQNIVYQLECYSLSDEQEERDLKNEYALTEEDQEYKRIIFLEENPEYNEDMESKWEKERRLTV